MDDKSNLDLQPGSTSSSSGYTGFVKKVIKVRRICPSKDGVYVSCQNTPVLVSRGAFNVGEMIVYTPIGKMYWKNNVYWGRVWHLYEVGVSIDTAENIAVDIADMFE